jgi:predicted membrane channel-forming protein YqfA (hemolysin III family)
MLIDYTLRTRTGDITTGGMPELVWFGLPLILAAISVLIIWRGASKWKRRWIGVTEVVAHVIVGVLVYLYGGLFYVLKTGIDSL